MPGEGVGECSCYRSMKPIIRPKPWGVNGSGVLRPFAAIASLRSSAGLAVLPLAGIVDSVWLEGKIA